MNTLFICILVFCSRIVDVSLGTIRTTIVVKGKNLVGSLIGFVEITVWFVVVQQVFSMAENNYFVVLAYALGFSTGTYVGGKLTSIIFKSKITVQVIINLTKNKLIEDIKNHGYALSILKVVSDKKEKKYMLLMEIYSNRLKELVDLIKIYDDRAFIIANETTYVKNGYFGLNK